MADLAYTQLSRPQKLAAFLIVIGPEAAAALMRHFGDAEVEAVCREMNQTPVVTEATRVAVLDEFASIVGDSLGCTLGGIDYTRRALELARGEQHAGRLLERAGVGRPAAASSELMAELGEMEGRQIHNLLKDEQPQTIAFVLSHLAPAKSAEVFLLFAEELREEIAERLGTIESTPRDLVPVILRNLSRHVSGKPARSYQASGGVRSVAALLNAVDKESSKQVLRRLEERNSALGLAVRRKMFGFEDIGRLSRADLQRVLREVDSAQLAVAMKPASEALRDTIYGAISKRAAESLRDEVGMLGSVKFEDIETAQDAVIEVVRRLEDEGAISLDPDPGAAPA